jgi:hypothetical protein
MSISMARNLVSTAGSLLDQMRETFCHPSEEETRGLYVSLIEGVQQNMKILLDARLERTPAPHVGRGLEFQYVKPIFDVDREYVNHGITPVNCFPELPKCKGFKMILRGEKWPVEGAG